MRMLLNPALMADFYKTGHLTMYPEGLNKLQSNFTPRNVKYLKDLFPEGIWDERICVAGLEYVITEMMVLWKINFFERKKEDVLKYISDILTSSLVEVPVDLIESLSKLHDLQYLPLDIKILKEGTFVPAQTPIMTVESIEPEFAYLANYIEDYLSAESWKVSTSATIASVYRKMFEDFAEKTGSPKEFCMWQGHDFSLRGMSGVSDAALTGRGHLLFFYGTDTMPAIDLIKQFHPKTEFIGGSVPATEHSVACANIAHEAFKLSQANLGLVGEELFKEAEKAYLKRLMEVYPSGVLSYVADTRNLWRVLDEIAPELKEEILARKPNALGLGKLVFRPDSGNPEDIICGTAKHYFKTMDEALSFFEEHLYEEASEACGDQCLGDDVYEEEFCVDGKFYKVKATVEYNRHDKRYYYVDEFKLHDPVEITEVECETMGCLNLLWKHFGGTTNEKGYKVLNEKVGLIYGDSITPKRAFAILTRMEAMGFASCNIVFGIGLA